MKSITKIVDNEANFKFETIDKNVCKTILISRPNPELGNQLLITPLVQEMSATFLNTKIDIFCKAGWILFLFENYDSIGTVIQLPKNILNSYLTI
jgi:ADP-heptose:LPS heptosyltransferase